MNNDIVKAIEICKDIMFNTLLKDIEHTTKILIWNDESFLVTIKHRDGDRIYEFSYHSDNKFVEISKDKFISSAVKEDEFGREYYVPEELIKYINK